MARSYKKTGVATARDKIRCPCCGWIVPASRFNLGKEYDFGVFRYWFCGKGDIRVEKVTFSIDEVDMLNKSLIARLREVIVYLGGGVEEIKFVPVENMVSSVPIENFIARKDESDGFIATPVNLRVEW